MKYLLLDTQNLFQRSKHVVSGDAETKAALALHIVLSSLLNVWNKIQADHVVVALEGRSWRKDVYKPYKLHRVVAGNLRTDKEKRDDEIFFKVMNEFITFLREKTNTTVLQSPGLEADDWIGIWAQTHPDDEHVIISSDTDFYQMLAPNVSMYNGIKGHYISINGVVDDKGKTVKDKQKEPLVFDPKWELFKKCIKGDAGDGVFPAHVPRTRETKLRQAFEDMDSKGYNWNNLMLEEWTDQDGEHDTVKNRYERNVMLISLADQPKEIRDLAIGIIDSLEKEPVSQIGAHFLKFCTKYELTRIAANPKPFADMLASLNKRL